MDSPGDSLREFEPIAPETELERVERWRLEQLLRAGYSVRLAERIAASDADLHQAVALVDAGCRPAVAALILL